MENIGFSLNKIKYSLLSLIDEDSKAFDEVMKAYSLPKKNDEDIKLRTSQIEKAYINAILTPMKILENSSNVLYLIRKIYKNINSNCLSDLGVAIELASASINGSVMNVKINLPELKDENFKKNITSNMDKILAKNDDVLFELNKNIIF